ncbi:hypothetical protein OGR47_20955 (plasmid) [Methylocystis sp. MJC1]|uniref:hypothetical protein n=1 Tax=Methylocystis sp. MJC1 TaxID=2654282 RepID=UPI0013EAF2A6|nr:hypothetical protein [Methylocystis sp. MJC1]KAF2989335.1 hypothetical protein MJC1_03653 [Methylocystis sp. MJC1]MBU6529365.1 hypothetical protein [Methylocystis sp. MJC1]UZX14225.1 hypothetical protein OGR47_20955 [Methylocystis sp. MJC1]
MAQVEEEICEPPGESILLRITSCLAVGMEAVLIPDRQGVVCAAPKKGGAYLDTPRKERAEQPRYPNPHKIDVRVACDEKKGAADVDKRLLPRSAIKDLVRTTKDKIDPQGIRIVGGIYCDGLDLSGVSLPYSLILDRSIFNGDVVVRNFRTEGDLSFDNVVSYKKFNVSRTEISGTLWGQVAFFKRLEIENSSIGGSVRLNGTIVAGTLTIDSGSIRGDVDVSASFFSNLEILRNNIAHVLDLGQSQARCSFDIRKNEIGDVVAVQLGFGEVELVEGEVASEPSENISETDIETEDLHPKVKHEHFRFKRVTDDANFGRPLRGLPKDPYDRYEEPDFGTGAIIRGLKQCVSQRSIRQGALVLIDNHIKSSLCIRSFSWPTDSQGRTLKGNIYLNEAVVGGATWLNLTRTPTNAASGAAEPSSTQTPGRPELNIFNVSTGTLVLNFRLTQQDIALKVNGLHFNRIYASQEACESALSLRAGKPLPQRSGTAQQPTFPPTLELPTAEQVTTWINKNEFARTQQPFAEFVTVFERAGNVEVATDLKIRASNFAWWTSTCSLLPASLKRRFGWCAPEGGVSISNNDAQGRTSGSDSVPWYQTAARWVEQLILAIFYFFLGILADYGYRPERIIWWVIGFVIIAWLFFRYVLKIVAFGVEGIPERIRPVGLVFLFDRLLPAYRIREENYKIGRFFMLYNSAHHSGEKEIKSLGQSYKITEATHDSGEKEIKRLGHNYKITEATPNLSEWAELSLDVLKFVGFVFAIFLVAAIGRLVH